MAATGFTPIQLYRTTTASAVPTAGNLADGELAINTTDEKLYFKNAAGTVKLLAANITPVANGGTGTATPSLVQGTGVTITGSWPNQTINATGTGTVTSVGGTGTVNGITLTGTVTSSGNLTLGGTLSGVNLTTQVTGTLPVVNGGTGVTTSTGSGDNVLSTSPTLVTPALGTPSSGTLSNCTVDGTSAVGFRNIPQNSRSANYTLVLTDAGKHIFHPVADNNARTFTIPANSSVAYPIGTALTFINMAAANVTIAITTDTLTFSPAGTTGSRTLATNGSATCIKITSTSWLISGSGLT
jgi:hypothetical protein